MIGSEGAFGILVAVTLKIFRYQPEDRSKFSYMFKNWSDAVEAVREIMQGEFGFPSVFRLSDPEETEIAMRLYGIEGTIIEKLLAVKGFKKGEKCMLLGLADGDKSYTRVVKRNIHKICKKYGAMYTTKFVTEAWEKGRFKDPYLREDLQDFGIMTDTLECAVSWDNLQQVYEGSRGFAKAGLIPFA